MGIYLHDNVFHLIVTNKASYSVTMILLYSLDILGLERNCPSGRTLRKGEKGTVLNGSLLCLKSCTGDETNKNNFPGTTIIRRCKSARYAHLHFISLFIITPLGPSLHFTKPTQARSRKRNQDVYQQLYLVRVLLACCLSPNGLLRTSRHSSMQTCN